MVYAKITRQLPTRPKLLNSLLSGIHIYRIFCTGVLLLTAVMIAAMGMLFSYHSKADFSNCPCLTSLSGRELTERDTPTENDKKVTLIQQVVDKGNQPPLRSQEANTNKQHSLIPAAVTNTQPAKAEHAQEPSAIPNKFKSEWWRNHTRTVCKSLGLSTNLYTIKPRVLSKVLVDDKHKILFCQIYKVASTNLGKVFAIIAGKFNGTNPDAIDSNDIHSKYNKLQVHLDSFPVETVIDKLKRYFKFVFVRDPFERLLSGYRNKFLNTSKGYFVKLNQKVVDAYRTNTSLTGGATFLEFVTYLVDTERKVNRDSHWQPMYELCRPCLANYDFVGKINSFGEDVFHILQINNLTGIMDKPKQATSHSFHNTDLYLEEFYSELPKPLLLTLYKMYYPDYAIFDFEVPKVILNMMK